MNWLSFVCKLLQIIGLWHLIDRCQVRFGGGNCESALRVKTGIMTAVALCLIIPGINSGSLLVHIWQSELHKYT